MSLLGAVGNVCWFFFSGFSGVHLSYQTGRLWHLGIASFCVFAFALGWSYFGKHLLHENWSLELRLLTQLSKISTSHQNRSHYDMKPSSSGLKRFLVIRKKKTAVFRMRKSVNIFFMKFSSLIACLKTWARMQLVWLNKKNDFDSSQVKW